MADIDYYRILRTQRNAICGEMFVKGKTENITTSHFAMENQTQSFDALPPGISDLKMIVYRKRKALLFTEVCGRPDPKKPNDKSYRT